MEHEDKLDRQWFHWKAPMLKNSWTLCLVLLLSQGVVAQTMPSAGSQMQQLPIVPSVPRTAPQVEVAPAANLLAPSKAGTVFEAQHLNVTGASDFTQAELLKVADFEPGRDMNLQALSTA
jgi:hypothetical protein